MHEKLKTALAPFLVASAGIVREMLPEGAEVVVLMGDGSGHWRLDTANIGAAVPLKVSDITALATAVPYALNAEDMAARAERNASTERPHDVSRDPADLSPGEMVALGRLPRLGESIRLEGRDEFLEPAMHRLKDRGMAWPQADDRWVISPSGEAMRAYLTRGPQA